MKKYQWRDGFRSGSVTAHKAHQELERLRAKEPLTASKVFEAAKPAKAPLHDAGFEWDGDAAVRRLGILHARNLMRAVEVLDDAEPEPVVHRVYVHVPDPEPKVLEGYYEPITVVVQQPDAYARAVDELERKFRAAEVALDELQRAAGQGAQPDRLAAITLATTAFAAARQALAALAA